MTLKRTITSYLKRATTKNGHLETINYPIELDSSCLLMIEKINLQSANTHKSVQNSNNSTINKSLTITYLTTYAISNMDRDAIIGNNIIKSQNIMTIDKQ